MDGVVQVYVELAEGEDYEAALTLREELRVMVGRESVAGGVGFDPLVADEVFEYEGFVNMLRITDKVIEFFVTKDYDFVFSFEAEHAIFKAKPSQVAA